MSRPLRIAQVAPPLERVPPRAYGGTERVVFELVRELTRRGHEVTTFASGDSEVPGRLIETVPEALRSIGYKGDPMPYFIGTIATLQDHLDEFDLVHSHLEWSSLLLTRSLSVPTVATFHGRLDLPWATDLLRNAPPRGLVAISENQASMHPDVAWTVIYNGLDLTEAPFERRRGDALCFVGRIAAEKGPVEAIEIAQRSGRPLRMAAKIGPTGPERDYYDEVFKPALDAAGRDVEFLGELDQADRDRLFAESYASLMPGSWPEPFGLVAIEALACGTPVIARRVGALPEIIRDGIDGFFGDDASQMAFRLDGVDELDREDIRASVLDRFSAVRMTDGYEALYRSMLGSGTASSEPQPDPASRVTPLSAARSASGAVAASALQATRSTR